MERERKKIRGSLLKSEERKKMCAEKCKNGQTQKITETKSRERGSVQKQIRPAQHVRLLSSPFRMVALF